MWIKAGILGDPGNRSSNLAVWTMAGLGLGFTIGLYSFRKWVEYSISKLGVLAREVNDNGIDRLPDDILCLIVSRLGTRAAVQTSILSRRWRNIWTTRHELLFTCLFIYDTSKMRPNRVACGDRQRFLQAVNQCLQLSSGPNLTKFSLHCCFLNDYPCELEGWMQTLTRFNIKELCLANSCRTCNDGRPGEPFTFSFKLIDGLSRLEYLHLMSCHVETSFVSQCNSLMTLTLVFIPLLSHQLSDILMSLPNLTRLCILQCELPPNLRISGPNLKLKRLKLYDCDDVQKVEISNINIVHLMINIDREVEVLLASVPKLESLDLRTPGMNYSFADAPRQMARLNYLSVQPMYQILGLPPNFQVFGNIRILCLEARGYLFMGACEEVDLWNFAPVLVACPLLEKFYLLVGGPACKEEREGQWPPVVRHKHLEYMEWSGFCSTLNELEFAKFIVTSAQVLQTLLLGICCRRCDDGRGPFVRVYKKDSEKIEPGVALECLLKDDFLSQHAALKFEFPGPMDYTVNTVIHKP